MGTVGMEIWRVSDKLTIFFRRSMPESPYNFVIAKIG